MADWLFNIACSEFGNIGYIFTPLSVYRIHNTSLWSSMPADEQLKNHI